MKINGIVLSNVSFILIFTPHRYKPITSDLNWNPLSILRRYDTTDYFEDLWNILKSIPINIEILRIKLKGGSLCLMLRVRIQNLLYERRGGWGSIHTFSSSPTIPQSIYLDLHIDKLMRSKNLSNLMQSC